MKTDHFQESEFKCKCGRKHMQLKPPSALFYALETIRWRCGSRPVAVVSGYRCIYWNRKVGGATGSLHLKAMAADIHVKGVSPKTVADIAEQVIGTKGGVGRYKTFTHVDVRGRKARWGTN